MEEEKKSGLHINLGGLIILVIIIILLFKVDIKSKIQSEQFQDNLAYIKNSAEDLWNKYVITPLKSKAGEVFIDTTNDAVKKLQDGFTENIINQEKVDNTKSN